MRRLLFLTMLLFVSTAICQAAKRPKIVKITVEPKEAAIYINNTLAGYGYAEFTRPKKKNEVIIIRCECNEYKSILTKFYGEDKRSSISFALQQDGFYRASAASGIVNKYFTIANMPVVSSNYWNNVHGKAADDVIDDQEGLQTMRNLARNMAWLLKCIEVGHRSGIKIPKQEERIYTNFIR